MMNKVLIATLHILYVVPIQSMKLENVQKLILDPENKIVSEELPSYSDQSTFTITILSKLFPSGIMVSDQFMTRYRVWILG